MTSSNDSDNLPPETATARPPAPSHPGGKDKIQIKIQESEASGSRLLDLSDSGSQPAKPKRLSFKLKQQSTQQAPKQLDDGSPASPDPQQFLHPRHSLFRPSVSPSAETDRFSLHSKSSSGDGNHLDESQGFFLDLDTLDFERSIKSSRFDESTGLLGRSHSQLLRYVWLIAWFMSNNSTSDHYR